MSNILQTHPLKFKALGKSTAWKNTFSWQIGMKLAVFCELAYRIEFSLHREKYTKIPSVPKT